MTTPSDRPFDITAVADSVDSEIDPVTPWLDEGDIAVTDAPASQDEKDEALINRVAKWVGVEPRGTRSGRERVTKPRRERKPIPPKPRNGQLVKPFTDLYVSIGTMMLPFDQVCGMAVIQSAPKCAEALEQLARENPAVRRALMAIVETSVWGAVIAAHAPILLAVAMHHVPAVRDNMPQPPQMNGQSPHPGMNGDGS